jgi:SAM-dependent methyltransferase
VFFFQILADSMDDRLIAEFIGRWAKSGGAERANYQLFLAELCEALDVARPEPTVEDDSQNAYVFERNVQFDNLDGTYSTCRIDLYKRGCFVLESKQGVEQQETAPALSAKQQQRRAKRKRGHGTRGTAGWDDAMFRARGQAEQYTRALPPDEGRPPFVIVVDVGHSIELYAEFSQTGGTYVPFPDAKSHRIKLDQLTDAALRERLRLVWTDPLSLDPARRSARVTREIAAKLAELAKSLEAAGHHADDVAQFLMRCLFTMFAEDVELLPRDSFRDLLRSIHDLKHFAPLAEELWRTMNRGGFSVQLRTSLLHFNGRLFADPSALALTRDQLDLLIEAAGADWQDVEPAIFGTLLERALDPVERHKLGAHYTPRAYVERLVIPAVIQPLRDEWDAVRAAAVTHAREGDRKAAVAELEAFHDRLCDIRVLDPACGSGNFLYVTLEHLKRLEGEVFATWESIAQRQARLEGGHTVDPHQLLGIEINPRAAAIAELVLWIGYLQWHFRTHGRVNPPEPVIKNFKNIQCRDAVLDWSSKQPELDEHGKPVTRWDGRTTKPHPVTGEEVPDETARVLSFRYLNPKKAEWPEADFIVGNPPFIGAGRMREALGDGYATTLRQTYDELPESCDYVMYWWHKAAELVRRGTVRQFGFIATNSLRQTFNRRVIQPHLEAENRLSIVFAIPDHPWVDSALGAAVRISMTVGRKGDADGHLNLVIREIEHGDLGAAVTLAPSTGRIHASLSSGVELDQARSLRASSELSCPGMKLHGAGFIVTREQATKLGLGNIPGVEKHIREYRNGRDLTQTPRGVLVIDLFGLTDTQVRESFPEIYQWVSERVRVERRAKGGRTKDASEYAENWWLFGKTRQGLRRALLGLSRYVATVETSKHRMFQFLDASVLPDNMLICVAHDDAFVLGVLSSRIHVTWALAAGGTSRGRQSEIQQNRLFRTFPLPRPHRIPSNPASASLASSWTLIASGSRSCIRG